MQFLDYGLTFGKRGRIKNWETQGMGSDEITKKEIRMEIMTIFKKEICIATKNESGAGIDILWR